MKITKSHLAKLIKEEMSKITKMRYAENKETGRWEEVVDGAEPQAPRRGSAREDIEDAIQMLESEDDVSGTLYYVIERLYTAIENL
tara:strand:+ start:140 stop:397 length:258 start_codon:yes stop_codon:yes gene_type:complete